MAEANSNDQICSECFKQAGRRYIFKCEHKLCGDCFEHVQKENNQVTCPVCKEIMNTDDVTSQDEKKHEGTCAICVDTTKDITHYCEDCDVTLCVGCKLTHVTDKPQHHIETCDQTVAKMKAKLAAKLALLQETKAMLQKVEEDAEAEIARVMANQENMLNQVDATVNEMIRKVNLQRDQMKQQIMNTEDVSDYTVTMQDFDVSQYLSVSYEDNASDGST